MGASTMKELERLHQLGQSIWLDNLTRNMLQDGTLQRYINEYSVTGLTSNPSTFEKAIRDSDLYDEAIRRLAHAGLTTEELFFELALQDLRQAAELFRPVHQTSHKLDGWVSLEVSPLLADDTEGTIRAAVDLHKRAQRPNLFIKIPGTPAGIPAIEEAIFFGVPVNVTLLFSREQYLSAAQAYVRGIERRLDAGLDPHVHSVASVFVSRWDAAVHDKVPSGMRNRLGIAIGKSTYKAYNEMLVSYRWRSLAEKGAPPQRLLWASTGTKDPQASPTLYVEALAAPNTINTMPDKTLLAFAEKGKVKDVLAEQGGDAETELAEFSRAGVDPGALAEKLQREGAQAFVKSWTEMLERIASKRATLA
jgi:transaldolase